VNAIDPDKLNTCLQYDPIVRGELGDDLHGCFLKDYSPSNW
jgi:hypothetical protein